jgi:hypothetical protein
MKRTGTLLLALFLGVCFASHCEATIYNSDGSAASVQALHNAALDGDTITLPAGTFTWSAPVTVSKAIKIQGESSGRIIGNTKSSVAVGTGAKTFTTTRSGLPITAGQTLRIAKMPKGAGGTPARENYMEGTVTSCSGTTLVMNITSTGGSGTWQFWWIATQPVTTIVNNYSNGGNPSTSLIQINQSSAGPTEVEGIRFLANPATTNRSGFIGLNSTTYLNPKTLIHDCWFQTDGGGLAAIHAATNQALVWNCSFDDTFSLAAAAITVKREDTVGNLSWTTNSTMGADDTNGATNFYVEDCDFHAVGVADPDSNARMVFRHNVFDNSGLSSHGADTGPIGLRHVELYDNELIFDNFGDCNGSVTLPVPWFFWMRGGTGVITDNVLPAISSCAWGNKGNILLSVLNTRRKTGGYPCWTSYPAPHQVGQGYGPGAAFHSYYSGANYGRLDYYTYLEPVYLWGNSGTGGNRVGLNAESDDPCGNNQQLTYYIQAGRDYKLEPKPGYAKFTYPHPARSGFQRPPPPTARATPSSPQRIWKNKGKKIKNWKWGKAKENSTNGMAEGQRELGE